MIPLPFRAFRRSLPFLAAALCLGATLSGAAPQPAARDRAAALRFLARVDSLRQAARIPGLAVVVLRDTRVVLARGLGLATVERGIPVTPDTPFNIASVSKPVSAVVAMKLVELGQLDLDRPMSSYEGFGEFCENARATGGIFFRDFACDSFPITLRQVMSMAANGTPGTRFWYNPVSYSWASRPMMQVSRMPFSELVARYVLVPARMTRSARIHRRLPLSPELAADLATPYHVDSAGKTAPSDPPPPQGDGAAGGVISTAMDLARFDIALSRGTLLRRASRDAMWSPARSPNGAALPYGLGWFVTEFEGERLLWHTGLWEGAYSALYLKVPGRRLTLILLANSDGLRWPSPLDTAEVQRSPFARALFETFAK